MTRPIDFPNPFERERERKERHRENFKKMNTRNWTLEGTVERSVLKDMPEITQDLVDADVFAVFRDGNEILLKPASEVEP